MPSTSNRVPSKRARESKEKTKTFTGCWTCRARKVKCDTTKPICARCTKSGLNCDGFDVKLYWITDEDKVPPSAIKRQAMGIECIPDPYGLRFDEVDQLLLDIDQFNDFTTISGTKQFGPFSVFNSQSRPLNYCGQTAEDLDPADSPLNDDSSIVSYIIKSPSSQSTLSDSFYDGGYGHTLDYITSSGSAGIPRCGANLLESSTPTPRLEGLCEELEPAGGNIQESRLLDRNTSTAPSSPSLAFELRSSVYRSPLAGILMNNYVHNIADLLQPISHPQNPYRSIYVPSAIIGSTNLLLILGDSGQKIPSSNVAIFYSLMATSAFHLRGVEDSARGGELDMLGQAFRTKAFVYLRKALCECSDEREEVLIADAGLQADLHQNATMAAMLSLVTADVMEGGMTEYWIHLDGVDKLQKSQQHTLLGDASSGRLHTVYAFLKTLSNTTSYDLPDLQWSDESSEFSFVPLSVDDHSLEFTYGITSKLASLMSFTTILAQHVSYYISRNLILPWGLEQACQSLFVQISTWTIESDPLLSIGSYDPTTLQLAKCHIMAFYHGIKVYYHTRIQPCNSDDMEFYVGAVATDLQTMENIKRAGRYNQNLAAPVTWPGFIAACEAERSQRAVWQDWWKGMLRYRIGNIARLWEIVQAAWDARDAGDMEIPGWMGILRKGRIRILAV